MEKDNIKDDEIRIIKRKEVEANQPVGVESLCKPDKSEGCKRKPSIFPKVMAFLLFGVVLSVILWLCYRSYVVEEVKTQGVYEPDLVEYAPVELQSEDVAEKEPFGSCPDSVKYPYTEVVRKDINDIPLTLYIPHNSSPVLRVGLPAEKDNKVVLTTQAADLRADNGKIVGAFVLAGEPLSWGLSKKGYCAILDGKVTVGMADNSPLFEEATEKGGYFFRQYALVYNGKLVENNLRNKSIRKALCVRGDEVFVAMTHTRESMHDFAQALVDLGVDNAIYLVGSYSYSMYRDENKVIHRVSGQLARINTKNVNFIEWR